MTGIVVVGMGFIADQHLAAIRGSDRAHLAGLVDTDRARAAAAARTNGGVRATTDLEEALAWDDADAVIVATPNDSHAPIGLRVAAAGRHLLVEKPMAISVDEALAARDAFAGAGRVLAVAHTHRAYDYSRAVHEVIRSGAIGRPLAVRLAFLGGWIWGDWQAWVLDPRRSGGHVLHNGVHLLDTVTWWMGERPETVFARGRRQTTSQQALDDHLELVLSFPSGGVAACEMSRAHRPARLAARDVLVVGTEGTIAQPAGSDAGELADETGVAGLPAPGGDAFGLQLAGFLDAIDGGAALAGPADGVFSIAMAVAAQRSIETGEPVAIGDVLPQGWDA